MMSSLAKNLAPGFIMAAGLLLTLAAPFSSADVTPELRDVPYIFKAEPGCPVDVISAKTTLEIDPVGIPMACRVYIDYTNVSNKALSGIRFRIGYIDGEEEVRGTFHAPDGSTVPPGGTGKGKWRGERVDPRTKKVMIRGLMARFSDGTVWESEKSEGGLIKPAPQPGQEGAKTFGGAGAGARAFGSGAGGVGAAGYGGAATSTSGAGSVGPGIGGDGSSPLNADPQSGQGPAGSTQAQPSSKPATPPAENFDSY